MQGLEPAAWETFALGQLGASAALLGLVFVGISINLRAVVASRPLVNRAGEAVLLLASLLLASTAVLIPGESSTVVGIELLGVGALTLVGVLLLQREIDQPGDLAEESAGPPRGSMMVRRALGLGAAVLVVIAGLTLLVDAGGGLYWWAASVAFVYLGSLSNAWVLLVEILR